MKGFEVFTKKRISTKKNFCHLENRTKIRLHFQTNSAIMKLQYNIDLKFVATCNSRPPVRNNLYSLSPGPTFVVVDLVELQDRQYSLDGRRCRAEVMSLFI